MATKQTLVVRHWRAEWTVTGLMLLFGTTTLAQAFVVPTPSTDTTIQVGDHLLLDKLVYAPANPSRALVPYVEVKRGDVIVFQYPLDEAERYVNRVVGVPRDRIRFAENQLIPDWRGVEEPFKRQNPGLRVPSLRNFPNEAPFSGIDNRVGELMVPAGMYFAMGDNGDNSDNSRFWGLVTRGNIYGEPILVWWSIGSRRTPALIWGRAKDKALHFFMETRSERTFRRITSYPLG